MLDPRDLLRLREAVLEDAYVRVLSKRRRKSGRVAAALPRIIPSPGSMEVRIASTAVSSIEVVNYAFLRRSEAMLANSRLDSGDEGNLTKKISLGSDSLDVRNSCNCCDAGTR